MSHFTGSEHWYRHGLVRTHPLHGRREIRCRQGGAYWLLDEIAFAQRGEKASPPRNFRCGRLKVNADRTATLICDDGNGNTVFTKAIPFTDFPPDEITLWFANNTIYLPSEH